VSTTDDRRAGGIPVATYESVQKSPDFQQLRRSYRGFAFPMTVAFLAWYMLYVLLSIFAPEFMATEVFGSINVGILLGLGQFASTALITWLYVRHANRSLDPLAEQLRHEIEEGRA
jgi:uncharacterized membrane protein (DUF485 family)